MERDPPSRADRRHACSPHDRDAPSGAELCRASYTARQVAGCVVLYATGVHKSSDHVVFFQRDPGEGFPPRFSLWHVRSGAAEVMTTTPFATTVSFQTIKQVSEVVVTDAAGRHAVAVQADRSPGPLHW